MKSYSLKVYSIRTPKYKDRKDIEVDINGKINKNHFEFNVIDTFFNAMNLMKGEYRFSEVNLPHIDEKCKITFVDYEVIDNDYAVVTLETDKYGSEKAIKDNTKNIKDGKLNENESVSEIVYLIITRKHGLLYTTRDYNTIINKSTLNTFFNQFRFVLYDYISKWNEQNEKTGLKVYKQPAIKIESLPSMDFFEEIDKLTNVIEFSYSFDPTGANDAPDFDDMDILKESGFSKREFKETRKFKDLYNKARIANVKKLYENLYNKTNYDELYVKGRDSNGKEKIIKPEFATRSEHILLKNISNLSIQEVTKKIDDLLKVDNKLKSKVYDLVETNEVYLNFEDNVICQNIVEFTESKVERKPENKDENDRSEDDEKFN